MIAAPARRALPSRRESETFDFEHSGVRYTATLSRFRDGDIAEMFLNAGKVGCAADAVAHDAAVLFSIACQFGVPVDVSSRSLAKLEDGNPAGPVGVALQHAGVAE